MVITSDSFENAPPSTLDPEANKRVNEAIRQRKRRSSNPDIRPENVFSSDEKVTQTIQTVTPKRSAPSKTVTPIKTVASEENLRRLEENPEQFQREEIERDRNNRARERINEIIREEIKKDFKPDPKVVGEVVKKSRETEIKSRTDENFLRASNFLNEKTEKYIPSPNFAINTFKKTKVGKNVFDAPRRASTKLSTRGERESQAALREPSFFRKISGSEVFQSIVTSKGRDLPARFIDTPSTRGFISGVGAGATNVVDVVVNYDTKILPPLASAVRNPLTTARDIDRGLSLSGDKIRVADISSQGSFVGETVAGVGIETAAFRSVIFPAKEFISARIRPDFVSPRRVPITREVNVNPFTRTRTIQRTKGDVLPDDYIVATDDYVVVPQEVRGFKRNVKTGETELVLENVPAKTGDAFDVKVAGGVKSTEETLSTQFDRAGTTQNLVSGQRGLIQEQDNIFSFLKNKKDFTINKPSSDPIEESLFFDPEGRLRTSRLGIGGESRTASLTDIAVGDFGGGRPEILTKPNTRIADYPSNLREPVDFIKRIGRQREGETVEQAVQRTRSSVNKRFPTFERDATKFQLETRGEPTVPAFFSRESETIFSSGQGARGERVGTTFLEGRKIKIFEETKLAPKERTPVSPAIVNQYKDVFSENLIKNIVDNNNKKPSPPVVEKRIAGSIGISKPRDSTLEKPTTASLSGLETREKPITKTFISPSASSTSRGFIAPSRPSIPTVSVTRTLDISEPLSPAPRSSSRSPRRSTGRSTPVTPRISEPTPSINSPPPSTPRGSPSITFTPRGRTGRGTTTFPKLFVKTPRLKPSRSTSTFTTQVLKKGKFITVGRASTKEGAFNIGSRAVGSTALRSFRVLKGATPINIGGKKFRRSKSKPFTVVEKNKFAINTGGEFTEITGKGIKKKKFRGFL